jgi:hypothetical protein
MFLSDIAISIEIIAIGVGVAFIIWSYRNSGKCIVAARIVGYLIFLSAIIVFAYTSFCTFKIVSGERHYGGFMQHHMDFLNKSKRLKEMKMEEKNQVKGDQDYKQVDQITRNDEINNIEENNIGELKTASEDVNGNMSEENNNQNEENREIKELDDLDDSELKVEELEPEKELENQIQVE